MVCTIDGKIISGDLNEGVMDLGSESDHQAMRDLEESWDKMKSAPTNKRNEFLEKMFNYANHVKDMAETYHHDLMCHFALSLRDFCQKIDIKSSEHQIIVQAHIDAMKMVLNESLQADDKKAEELKKMVEIAIKKHT